MFADLTAVVSESNTKRYFNPLKTLLQTLSPSAEYKTIPFVEDRRWIMWQVWHKKVEENFVVSPKSATFAAA